MKYINIIILFALLFIINNSRADLVRHYPFDGNANNAIGNGYNGTVNGATLTTDRFGNANSAYQFNGNGWGGYGDWYLPSKYELSILYQQRNTVGGFNSGWIFWSSTEADDKTAWSFDFVAGTQQADSKILTTRFIRAIRSF